MVAATRLAPPDNARTVILLDTNVLIYASPPESGFRRWGVAVLDTPASLVVACPGLR